MLHGPYTRLSRPLLSACVKGDWARDHILLSHAINFVQVSVGILWLSNKEDRERDQVCILITSSLVQCHAPGLIAITKLKTDFEGLFRLSTKISTHENYPPYGMQPNTITTLYQLHLDHVMHVHSK